MAYDIPTRFHQFDQGISEKRAGQNWCGRRKNNKNNNNKISYDLKDHNMAPNSKNHDDYQFARAKSTWKPKCARIGGFLYFGGHFGFKMVAIWCSMSYFL
jgi:hypothetical protein